MSPPPRQVLLGWELGGGLSHVRTLARLAQALAAHGPHPVLVVKDLVAASTAFRDAPFPVLQAPLRPPRPGEGSQPFLAASYADILAVRGFAAVEELWPTVQAWQGLLDLVRPALVVCDHSPTLCLAAYVAFPVVLVGDAFTMPPADGPTFPALVPGRAPVVPEEQLLAVVREAQRRRGRPAPDTLPGLFTAAERFLTCLPELDPYRVLRHEPHQGPLGSPLGPPLLPPERPSFFAYLSTEIPCVEPILAGLARSGYRGTAHVLGATPALRSRLRGLGLEILDEPAPLDQVLARAAAVVHHGGAGLCQQALSAGRPQLLFPDHLERILNAQCLDRLGAGFYLTGRFAETAVPEALRRLLGDPGFTAQSQAVAHAIRASGPWDPLPRILDRCLALVRENSLTPSGLRGLAP